MYPTYNNQYYIQDLQNMKDRIDKQLQQMTQPQQQTPITQNFQLAPPSHQFSMKFANTIEDVNKELVYTDTPFFSKDLSVLWIKNVKGEVKAYELTEIVQKDAAINSSFNFKSKHHGYPTKIYNARCIGFLNKKF